MKPVFRDWPYELTLIAHYCPGMGDPRRLSLTAWNAILEKIPKLIGMK